MDDPFASMTSECIIPPEIEKTIPNAPLIGEPSFFAGVPTLAGQTSPEIPQLPVSSSNPPDKESLKGVPARNESSSLPPGRLRPEDLSNLIKYFCENSDRSLGREDILEIAERKGISFSPPAWWRPGGYD